MAKINIPLAYGEEAQKIEELLFKHDRTTSGNTSFTSNSSGTTYKTADSTNPNILNCGETGLLKLLIETFKTSNGWLLMAEDFNAKADETHSHGAITSDGKIGASADKALYTGTGGNIQSGVLPPSAGGTGKTSLNELRDSLGLGNDISQSLPIEKGGTGANTVAGARNALGLGNSAGAVPIANGGTGATSAVSARANLGIGDVATEDVVPISKGGTGASTKDEARSKLGIGSVATENIVPISKGGTGASTISSARNALGLGNTEGAVPIANGGTGATTKKAAKTALGISYGTTSPSGGSDGDIYIQYSQEG